LGGPGYAVAPIRFAERGLFEVRLTTTLPDGCQVTSQPLTIQVVGSKPIALTFDDGPGRKNTLDVADWLDRYGARGTFFLICSRLENKNNSKVARRVAATGHQLGSHRWDHDFSSVLKTAEQFTQGLERCDEVFLHTLGFKPTAFRFPWGYGRVEQFDEVRSRGMAIFGWDGLAGDGSDHQPYSPYIARLIADNVLAGIKPGAVLLLHDAPNHPNTAAAIPLILAELADQGYDCVTVEGLTRLGWGHREDFSEVLR
jgi:peptidoglycan/xylan/chitin deacetylase (PgdA/CDA1 family)